MLTLKKEFINETVSTNTLNTLHLVETFTEYLQNLTPACFVNYKPSEETRSFKERADLLYKNWLKLYNKYQGEFDNITDDELEELEFILHEDLYEILNEIAPVYCSFTSSIGNGSDIGFYHWEELDMALEEKGISFDEFLELSKELGDPEYESLLDQFLGFYEYESEFLLNHESELYNIYNVPDLINESEVKDHYITINLGMYKTAIFSYDVSIEKNM